MDNSKLINYVHEARAAVRVLQRPANDRITTQAVCDLLAIRAEIATAGLEYRVNVSKLLAFIDRADFQWEKCEDRRRFVVHGGHEARAVTDLLLAGIAKIETRQSAAPAEGAIGMQHAGGPMADDRDWSAPPFTIVEIAKVLKCKARMKSILTIIPNRSIYTASKKRHFVCYDALGNTQADQLRIIENKKAKS